jgi:hypothetical protein
VTPRWLCWRGVLLFQSLVATLETALLEVLGGARDAGATGTSATLPPLSSYNRVKYSRVKASTMASFSSLNERDDPPPSPLG